MRRAKERTLRVEQLERRQMLSVTPVAPTIETPVSRTSIATATSEFTFAFSDANPADTHAAAVDWGDGTPFTHLDSVTSPFTLSHRYDAVGTYQPRLWVTDSTNRTDIETFTMKVYPLPIPKASPTPAIQTVGDRTSIAGATSTLTFHFADANPLDTHDAAIDWGDGTPIVQLDSVATGFTSSHAYEQTGVFTPKLWVTDSTNRTGIETFSMTVYPNPNPNWRMQSPEIVAPVNRSALSRVEADFQFEFSDRNPDDTFSAAVDWGDGSPLTQLDSVTSPFSVKHAFENPGDYTPKVWVTDSTGRSTSAEFTMTVYQNPGLVIESPPVRQTGYTRIPLSVDVAFSDPVPDEQYSLRLDWGDAGRHIVSGNLGGGFMTAPGIMTAEHTYFYPGTYIVEAIVGEAHPGFQTDRTAFVVDIINHPDAPEFIGGSVTAVPDPNRSSIPFEIEIEFSDPSPGETHTLLVCSRELGHPHEHILIIKDGRAAVRSSVRICEQRELSSPATFTFFTPVGNGTIRPQIWITNQEGFTTFVQPFELTFVGGVLQE